MTQAFTPYPGFSPEDGDEPAVTLDPGNPCRPSPTEGLLLDGPAGPEFIAPADIPQDSLWQPEGTLAREITRLSTKEKES